jgi:cyclic pyranopterin phosphate synthase
MKLTHIERGKARMVDISEKKDVLRIARAEGFIKLKTQTIEAIKKDTITKGNVLAVSRTAGIMGAKKTSELIPMCHPISVTSITVDFDILPHGIKAISEVKTQGKTGVEMEALTAVSIALLTVWDMVKSMEKDESGNYPGTAIENIRVMEKIKKPMED